MNRISKAAAVLLTTTFVSVVPISVASAGVCDAAKFCIYQNDNGGGGLYKTFNLTMNHDNLKFDNGVLVRDRANSVRNRTSCKIRVIDDRGFYPDDWQDFNGNSNTAVNLIASVDNENDRHERKC